MNLVLLAGAGISLLYFLIIAVSTGMGSSFGYFWLIVCLILLLVYVLRRFFKTYPMHWKIPLCFKVSSLTTAMLAAGLFVLLEVLIIHSMFLPYPDDLDYVIVLGARVEGEQVSSTLEKRLDTALEYVEGNPEVMVVVSGGQGNGESISEAEAMSRYLTEGGLEEARIIKESDSSSTAENLHNSFSCIIVNWSERGGTWEEETPTVGVISSNYHIFRAKAIAGSQGFPGVSGIPAPSDEILLPNQLCREFFALIKDWFVGNI